jgi:translin
VAVESRRDELATLGGAVRVHLDAMHRAREEALRCCRETIRSSGLAIRAVHRQQPADAVTLTTQAESSLRRAQGALEGFPALAAAGFLHDAEKEYAESLLTMALVSGEPLCNAGSAGVGVGAWLNGLAEAASELRRYLLDRLRAGEVGRAEQLLTAMEDVYDLLVTVDYPDAMTGGLRRATDALRAVLERSRSDVTTTVLQSRLQDAIEKADRSIAPGD